MQLFNVDEEEEYIVPNLMRNLQWRDQDINELEGHLEKVTFVKGLHEEDNLRLRAIITDMQYNFQSTVAQKNIEISRLTGRVQFLEEELYHLNRLPQNKYSISNKDEFDPSRMKELERQVGLKDTQISDIQNELQAIKQQIANRVQEATTTERKKVQKESEFQNLPFLVENDKLKKQNQELNRQVDVMNQQINELRSKLNEAEAELERRARKLREYLLVDKMRDERDEDYKQNLKPVYVKVSEDKNLLDGLLSLIHYVRESIADVVFEIFVRSANQAYNRKQSSTILFTINVKQLKERNVRGFVVVLYLYKKMKQFVKVYFPYYGKFILNDQMARMALGEQQHNMSEKRDATNLWLESCLSQIQQTKLKGKKDDENKEYNNLFRLLSLRYRTKYPIRSQEQLKIDLDVRIRLENKICTSLLKLFIDE